VADYDGAIFSGSTFLARFRMIVWNGKRFDFASGYAMIFTNMFGIVLVG